MLSEKKLKEMEQEEHSIYHRRILYVLIVILIVLFSGATFYHYIEGWRYLNALYFSAYTITTIGYGDFVPRTDAGKIFTIFYAFAGVAIALYGLSIMASHFVEAREEFWLEKISKIRIRHHTKTFWEKLKDLMFFKSEDIVGKDIISVKKK